MSLLILRAPALHAIGTFAANHQVLSLTCHPDHAGELQSLAGARTLQMTRVNPIRAIKLGSENRLLWDFTTESTENTEAPLTDLQVSIQDLRVLRVLRG
jgi:hypothetical protein